MAAKKDYRKIMRELLNYLKAERLLFILAILLVLIANLLSLWGPRYSGIAIDAMSNTPGQSQMNVIIPNTAYMILCYAGSSLLTFLCNLVMVRASQNVIEKMRQDAFDKIVELPLAYIDSHQAGDLVSRISYDLDVVNQSLSADIVQIVASLITVVGSLSMMFALSSKLSIFFLFLLPFTVFFTRWRVKKTRPLFSVRSRKLGFMNGYVEETLIGQKTIQAYGQEDYFNEEFSEINLDSSKAYYAADRQASLNGPSVMLISNISLALVSMFGALLYLNGSFSLGILSTFIIYSRRFSGPINQLANIIADLQTSASAAERVFRLLAEDSEPADHPDAIELSDVKGEIQFHDVDFAYDEENSIMKKLNFTAQPATLTAIVGPTGAGKTTLINLLMRFYDPQSGEILLDGRPLLKIKRESLRRSFAMVLQDPWLFQGSIKENIAYGRSDASDEEIEKAAKAAHIHDFISSLPNGYETEIRDGASNLSQGQRQLLTIARAMLLDSPMLILDEATSNVDSHTELEIQDAMNHLIKGRTSFVIAHRLSTIQNADRILLIQDGKILESGKHQELLDLNGAYANLYQAQFS